MLMQLRRARGEIGDSGRTMPISVRARDAGPREYFSESLAAYRFEDSFADKDPEGYHMVEEILRLAWRK